MQAKEGERLSLPRVVSRDRVFPCPILYPRTAAAPRVQVSTFSMLSHFPCVILNFLL